MPPKRIDDRKIEARKIKTIQQPQQFLNNFCLYGRKNKNNVCEKKPRAAKLHKIKKLIFGQIMH